MASSLPNLVNNLAKGIHKIEHDNKNCETFKESNTKIVSNILNTQVLKMIQQNTNVYVVARITEKIRSDFPIHTLFY